MLLGQFYYCSRLYMCTAYRELCHKTCFNLEFPEGRGACVCIILIRTFVYCYVRKPAGIFCSACGEQWVAGH